MAVSVCQHTCGHIYLQCLRGCLLWYSTPLISDFPKIHLMRPGTQLRRLGCRFQTAEGILLCAFLFNKLITPVLSIPHKVELQKFVIFSLPFGPSQ